MRIAPDPDESWRTVCRRCASWLGGRIPRAQGARDDHQATNPGSSVPNHRRRPDSVRRQRGSQGPTLLLTSPWPESLYAFAPMWATLAEQARVFAIDLPGFGASERREDLLSPRAMGGFLARLIAEADLGTTAHRRARRRNLGGAVRGGGASRAHRKRDRRQRRGGGSDPTWASR